MSDVAVFDPSEPSRRGHGSTFVVILQRLAYLREHENQKEKCLVAFDVTPSRL